MADTNPDVGTTDRGTRGKGEGSLGSVRFEVSRRKTKGLWLVGLR